MQAGEIALVPAAPAAPALPPAGVTIRHFHSAHEFTGRAPVSAVVPADRTVAELVTEALAHVPVLVEYAVVWIGDDRVPRDMWHVVRLKQGAVLNIKCPMQGGDGKNPLSTILSLGLLAVAPVFGAALAGAAGGWIGGTFFGVSALTTAFTGAINIAGRLLINALIPPAKPRGLTSNAAEKPTQFIAGAKNQITPWGVIPLVLGKHRMVPPYAARPYTETVGDQQYVRMLFLAGYGTLEMSDLKIGETSISEYEDVEWEFIPNYDGESIIPLFSNAVLQDDYDVLITQEDGYTLRTTATDADEISVDITFKNGLTRITDTGGKSEVAVQMEIQYSPTGEDDWSVGVESYKPIESQVSPEMPRPSKASGFQSRRLRIYRVYLDTSSGVIGMVKGNITVVGVDDPHVPSIPAGMEKIGQVWRYSDDAEAVSSVIDERGNATTNGTFEESTDFAPAATGGFGNQTITVAAGGLKFPGLFIRAKQAAALRRSVSFKVPARGQYDVRVRRITADSESDLVYDKATLTAIRTVRYVSPVRRAGVALLAMRMRATDQISGTPDAINAVFTRVCPDWDADAEEWTDLPTSNPAALYRYVLQGAANEKAVADTGVDLPALQEWHAYCAAEGFEYNAVIDSAMSVSDLLREIAAAGRARPAAPELIWSVIRETPDAQPVQMFTPVNSFDFKASLAYPVVPHALRVRYLNADKNWSQDEAIVYADGYNEDTAEKYESIEAAGVTNHDQAWRFGRYYMANLILRPESFTFRTDVENLRCTRGDMIRFQHDAVLIGLGSGRITGFEMDDTDMVGIMIDEVVTMVAGKNYAVRIRLANGTQVYKPLQTVVGDQTSLVFSTPIAVSDPNTVPAIGDLAVFGEAGLETIQLLIKEIIPEPDYVATITCVDYAPAIFTADTGTIPPPQTVITIPPELLRPPTPQLASLQADESVLIKNADGSYTTAAVISLAPHGWPVPLTPVLKVKGTAETEYVTPVYTASGNKITVLGLDAASYYDFKIFYTTADGKTSAPLPLTGVLVLGDTSPPSDVMNFKISVLAETAYLSWDAVPDIDLAHYELKFSGATEGATWGSSTYLVPVVSRDATAISVQAQEGTYLIKAVDRGGRVSVNAALIIAKGGALANYNAIETIPEHPAFAGAKTNVVVTDLGLRLDAADTVDDWDNWDLIENIDLGEAGLQVEGIYEFATVLDLSEVYVSRITTSIQAQGFDLNNNVDEYENWDALENIDGAADSSKWRVDIQISSTDDDPEDDPTWGAWQDFVIGEYSGRAHRFRAKLISTAYGVSPLVTALSVTIDMPDRTEGERGKISFLSETPTVVTFPIAFKAIPAVTVTAQSMVTGDTFEITNQTRAGFEIIFKNAGGSRITRTFDYVAKGYGRDLTEE